VARFEKGASVFEITSNDGNYTSEQRKHYRDGWTRVADLRCEIPLGAEPHNPVFEDALRSDPSDVGAALVYADWLQQQGHPRGALIAVQAQLAANPRDTRLVEAERRIIEEAAHSLLSKPLLAHLAILRAGGGELAVSRNLFDGGTATFDHGFLREALVVVRQRGCDEDVLWELLRHPSARMLAKLGVSTDRSRDIALVATLITHGPRPPLRSLLFRVDHRGMTVDLAGLDAAYPALEELELAIHNVRFDSLKLPKLRRLCVRAEHGDLAVQLAANTWPELEVLSIFADPVKLALPFEQPNMPKLRTLELVGAGDYSGAERSLPICRLIARSPLAKQIEVLELPKLDLSQQAVWLLVEHRAKFEKLVALRTGYVSPDRREQLRAAGFPV
jgi:uncharacterized protein (TIGR02996 family)